MFGKFFDKNIYIQVYSDRMVIQLIGSQVAPVSVIANPSYTHTRMLIGTFSAAETVLKQGFAELNLGRFGVAPRVLIQAREKCEGGLNQIESRVLRELALGAGASDVIVHPTSEELSHEQVITLLGRQ